MTATEKEYAIKCYDWHGNVIGYQQPNKWIPANADIHESREIEERISAGICELREPEIKKVQRVSNADNSLRGYVWEGKFIPQDRKNSLFCLIDDLIEKGDCFIEEPQLAEERQPEIGEFILGVYFDSQWLSIEDEIDGWVEYEYGNSASTKYHVVFRNLYREDGQHVGNMIANLHGVESFPFPANRQPAGSVLEIELPVGKLKNVFRAFCSNMRALSIDISYLDDELEMHLAETGRSKKRGPTTEWLINHLWEYDQDFVMDIGNRAMEYFSLERYSFEDKDIKHISTRDIYSRHYIIRSFCNGSAEWHKLGLFQDPRFYNPMHGESSINNETPFDIINSNKNSPDFSRTIHYETRAKYERLPQKKVRIMLERGLTLEAVCILNGYLETQFKLTLLIPLKGAKAFSKVEKADYSWVLTYIKKNAKNSARGKDYLSLANEIRKMRNEYLHEFIYPEESPFLTNKKRMEIEQLCHYFIDAHESQMFLVYLDSVRLELESLVKAGELSEI